MGFDFGWVLGLEFAIGFDLLMDFGMSLLDSDFVGFNCVNFALNFL